MDRKDGWLPAMRRGTTIISPTSTFVIFNNNTEMVRGSADPETARKLPARLELNTMKDFVTRYVSVIRDLAHFSVSMAG